jgi:hypothetical protein
MGAKIMRYSMKKILLCFIFSSLLFSQARYSYVNSVILKYEKPPLASVFNGTNQSWSIADGSENQLNFERTDSFSVIVRFKRHEIGGAAEVLIGKQASTGATAGYSILLSTDSLRVFLRNTTNTNELQKTHIPVFQSTSTWYYLVVTYNGTSDTGGIKAYMNGSLLIKSSYIRTLSASILNTGVTCIGSRNAAGNRFSGKIGFTQVIKGYVMTQSDVARAYDLLRTNKQMPMTWGYGNTILYLDWSARGVDKSFARNNFTPNNSPPIVRAD